MKILVCNDDGIKSEGIILLAKALSKKHEVLVIAPKNNKSATGHAITINKSIKLKKVSKIEGVECYSLTGTPADCVKFAVNKLKFVPDAVVSGINNGPNLGTDILYSGTVSAALEAVSLGFPAVAVSSTVHGNNNFEYCAEFIAENIDALIEGNDKTFVWNINIPNLEKDKISGIKHTKMGVQLYSDYYKQLRKNVYFLYGEPIVHDKNNDDCDVEWNLKGYITVTPILFDKTDYKILNDDKNKIELKK